MYVSSSLVEARLMQYGKSFEKATNWDWSEMLSLRFRSQKSNSWPGQWRTATWLLLYTGLVHHLIFTGAEPQIHWPANYEIPVSFWLVVYSAFFIIPNWEGNLAFILVPKPWHLRCPWCAQYLLPKVPKVSKVSVLEPLTTQSTWGVQSVDLSSLSPPKF